MVLFSADIPSFSGGGGVQYIINTVPDTNMTPNYARKQFVILKRKLSNFFQLKKGSLATRKTRFLLVRQVERCVFLSDPF